MNRLGSATSPYLQQHKDNPVHWWEWSPEAFDEARRRKVPILLSVGYAACHWCHVMAHESFEDDATAAFLNEHYVSIKVDREERPDVDAVYMQATTALTGQGGWPMTCILDHDGRPFFAGTYFPDQPRHGQPSFTQVLQAIHDAWLNRRDEIEESAAGIAAHLKQEIQAPPAALGETDLDQAVQALANQFDPMAGGFGAAPKFPPSMVLEFLRRYSYRVGDTEAGRQASHMFARTMHAMAGSGMYDQLGGGFARYSVDRGWVVPHFEKMLYDDAQLLALYANAGRLQTAAETADFMIRELRTAEGGFASALDADTDGVEGAFYAWTPAQLNEVLGDEDGGWAAEVFNVTTAGTFEHGTSTLQLRHRPEDEVRLQRVRQKLFEARDTRTYPARDDKVVAAWNGLALSGLCAAAIALNRADLLDAASDAAHLLLDLHTREGRLLRVSRDGRASDAMGVLEDYGCVAQGYLDLAQATADPRWIVEAGNLLDAATAHFRTPDGGFYDTADDAEMLVARPRDPSDNASPGGTSAIIHALVTYAAITGEERYRSVADEALAAMSALAIRSPRFAGWALAAAEAMTTGPLEIAIIGEPGEARDALATASRIPGAIVMVATNDQAAQHQGGLLSDRRDIAGEPAAYVCRNLTCQRPVTAVAELLELLAQ
ncbi:MAG TPA: thioredoxin domain-containing protein [Marmoricola sp.]|nr:thioredoxin domain-containing protein [Marmoricola sp.]